MRLASVTIENFRSITSAYKIVVSNTTVLVGPNNEGKSNILRALVLAMRVLARSQRIPARANTFYHMRGMFEWERDFPLHLQKRTAGGGVSVVILDFSLTADDVAAFKSEIGSSIKDNLPIKVAFGPTAYSISVHKKGPGSKTLSNKSAKIAAFVASRIDFEHIPAIRTARAAETVVEELVARALGRLEDDAEYIECLTRIEALQQPILSEISAGMKQTLSQFLPALRSVEIVITREQRHRAMRQSCQILVDDGTPTLLEHKGDGVQSLAALAIMRHATERGARGRSRVVAIEEPESHLHPHAIHELRAVLQSIEETNQVILTTHNPLFVDRSIPSNNVIVHKTRARPAKNIDEIRRILGVRASDNLRQAELVLVVEGDDDRASITSLLSHMSATIKEALKSKTLALDAIGGASKLAYKLGELRDSLCQYHALLDNDSEGRTAGETAVAAGLIADADINYITCQGKPDSELEDVLDASIYCDIILEKHRVNLLECKSFRNNRKWSQRMRDSFRTSGKQWNDRIEKQVKLMVSDAVAQNPGGALSVHHASVIEALVSSLEARLVGLRDARARSAERVP